jgi:hypothetical protein
MVFTPGNLFVLISMVKVDGELSHNTPVHRKQERQSAKEHKTLPWGLEYQLIIVTPTDLASLHSKPKATRESF